MAKNKRQPYAVSEKAGHQTSAESWGTGMEHFPAEEQDKRTGALTYRIHKVVPLPVSLVSLVEVPTVPVKLPLAINVAPAECSHPPKFGANGIRRSTSDRSKATIPPLTSSQLNHLTNIRRFATASALAASSVPPLLQARGHRISTVPEVPLVIASDGLSLTKTKAAVELLKAVGAGPDITKVSQSRKLRAGKGKLRGRRHRQRRGPLIVYNPEEDGKDLVKAFRNIPGVETSSVFALNLLQLAPGGHLGRFIVWTSSAFATLDTIYGSTTTPSALKKDFLLPSNVVANADITRLINSAEVQAVVRAKKGESRTKRAGVQKKNP
ncbi:MAG: hypothetical protein L6R39_003679, partial [Caloplaca ligustica]